MAINLKKVNPIPSKVLEDIGFHWHTDMDGTKYIADEIVQVSEAETEAYAVAANELYDMFVQGAEYVIENNLFHELAIPFNLIDIIKLSFENDLHWHLYGRFDFAGGIDGMPIKLLEFNADTPTALFETSIIQWALLRHNNMNESYQFNNIYEGLKNNFKRVVTLLDDPEEFVSRYENWKMLFSSARSSVEEINTVKFLQQIAHESGWISGFTFMDEVGFDPNHGIFDEDGVNYEFWFKLFPWEEIALQEPGLLMELTDMIKNQKVIFLNPAYTLLFHSKGMLKILKDLYPDSPYLLDASFEPLVGKKQVKKPMLGREGQNVSIIDEFGKTVFETTGVYSNVRPLYQEFVDLPKDSNNLTYQAGVFFAYEAIGLGFRRGGQVLDNMSKFVSHVVV
jgi:glutathionylspermidine synthase